MLKNPLIILFCLLIVGGLLNYFISGNGVRNDVKTLNEIKKADETYKQGENAQTVGKRQEFFNQALKLNTALEAEFHPINGNGKLYFNIANSYFQLEQYPYALLYYHRAYKLRPRDEKIKQYIAYTNENLGIQEEETSSVFGKIFFFYTYFSLPEKLQTFFFLTTFSLIFTSFWIWKPFKWSKRLAQITGALGIIMLLIFIYSYYFTPTQAILIRGTNLYRGAGEHYAKVLEEPLLSGTKVEVVEVLTKGSWLKIVTSKEDLGYVPSDAIRII